MMIKSEPYKILFCSIKRRMTRLLIWYQKLCRDSLPPYYFIILHQNGHWKGPVITTVPTWNIPDSYCLVKRSRNNQVFCRMKLSTHHIVIMSCENTVGENDYQFHYWIKGEVMMKKINKNNMALLIIIIKCHYCVKAKKVSTRYKCATANSRCELFDHQKHWLSMDIPVN